MKEAWEGLQTMAATRILIVDDHPLFREALKQALLGGIANARVTLAGSLDAATAILSKDDAFDLILLDPPFQSDALTRVLPTVARVLAPGGMVYVESAQPLAPDAPPLAQCPDLILHRAGKAGQVHYHLLLDTRTALPASGAAPASPPSGA